MINLGFTVFLYGLVALVLWMAARRRDGSLATGLRSGANQFLFLIPRLTLGVIGAGFMGEVLPREAVSHWLGAGSGFSGIALASVAGALTPGGAILGFTLAGAAMKAGAGFAPLVAYLTAWSLFTLNRILIFELPMMPRWFVLLRLAVSLPMPFLLGAVGLVIG